MTKPPLVALDACSMRSGPARHLFVELARRRLFRPVWSAGVLDELQNALEDSFRTAGVPESEINAKARVAIGRLRQEFPAAEHASDPHHRARAALIDDGDAHVLQAAVERRVQVIVTENLKHFRSPPVAGHVRVVNAAEFFDAIDRDQPTALPAASRVISSALRATGRADSPTDVLTDYRAMIEDGLAVAAATRAGWARGAGERTKAEQLRAKAGEHRRDDAIARATTGRATGLGR